MPDVKPGKYAELLEEMRKRFDYASDQWQDIRAEGAIDMRYVSGDPWDTQDRLQREQAGRPVLSLDELGQYTNQLINDIRQHKRAIRVTPIGAGANDDTARTRGDLIRQIEYRSNAQQAYTTMFENTVNRSYGFLRLKAQYVQQPKESGGDGSAFNQELLIEPIVNPDNVTIDPDALRPDGSDMQYAWIAETWPYEEYRRAFPKARVQDFDSQLAKVAPTWMDVNRIRLAEYFTIDTKKRTLLLFKGSRVLPNGQPGDLEVFEDEWDQYPALATVKPDAERVVEHPTVSIYLTNGFEVLKRSTWPGPEIPIVCCYGKILYVDDGSGATRKMLSLVRLARDPYMLYCYYRTTEAELVGMTPKVPYFVRRGSLKPDQLLNLQKSLHEPVAVIEVEGTSESMPNGASPEMPIRNPYEPAIQAMEIGAEGARRAIQAAMGISPLPTAAQRQTEKSGVALKQIHDAEQQGSFHFIDAYEMAITRVGALANQNLDVYFDTARDVTLRNDAGEPRQVRLNDPLTLRKGQDKPAMLGTHDEHDVTLSTGPSFDSERDAANDFADTLVTSLPAIAPVIGAPAAAKLLSLTVKLKNLGPIGDEIAKLLSPPEPENGLPPQVMQAVQQLQAENQQLKMAQAIDAAKQQADIQKTQISKASDERIAAAKNQTDLLKTQIMAEASLSKSAAEVDAENFRSFVDAFQEDIAHKLELHLQKITEHLDRVHEARTQATDHQHKIQLERLKHSHALQQGAQQVAGSLVQGAQSHQAALEQGQQDAALTPTPTQ